MGGLGSAIVIIIVVTIWVIKGLSAVMGNNENKGDAQRKRRSLEDWDELQARRRAELAQQSRQHEGLEEIRIQDTRETAGSSANPSDPSQMTMAQRIELARQRARQQKGGDRLPQADDQAEALRQSRDRAERAAQQQRRTQAQQQAQREQTLQERAARERERQVAERRRLAEQRDQAEREQLRQSRSKRKRTASGAKQAQASASAPKPAVKPSPMRAASYQRVHQGHGHARPAVTGTGQARKASLSIGPLDAASLRKAFILKELLDKPLAMRNPQDDLLS